MSTKLPPLYLFLLVLAACIAIIALFFNLVINPRKTEIQNLRDNLASQQQTLGTYRSAVADIPALKDSITKMENENAVFIRALPTTTQFGQIIDQLRATASAAKVDLKGVTFSKMAGQGATLPAGVQATTLNLDMEGTYGALYRVLQNLETQNRFTTVNNVSFTSAKAESNDPLVNSNMSITVYTYDPAAPASGTASPATDTTAAPAAAPAPSAPAAAPAAQPSGGTQ